MIGGYRFLIRYLLTPNVWYTKQQDMEAHTNAL